MTARMDRLAYMEDWVPSATAPATTFAGMLWLDTSADPYVLKRRNPADDGWVTVSAAPTSTQVRDVGRWEVIVDGSPPAEVTDEAETDWVYGWISE